MRLSRAELAVLLYIGGLAVAAAVSWTSAVMVGELLPEAGGAAADRAAVAVFLSKVVGGILAVAVVFGLVWFYPAIRRDAHERGRLAHQSKSYMHAALTDPLTGLQNRRYFDDALSEYMREFSAIDLPLGMMIVDLDHFKSINDTHGHDNGDHVLRSVSWCLRQQTRYHDVLARIGGEEFAVILPNTNHTTLGRIAERIREAIADLPIVLSGNRVQVTTSIGIAVWDGEQTAEQLVKSADENLYVAKAGGRNRVAGQVGSDRQNEPIKPIFGTG